MTCDRVAMVFAGRTSSVGPLHELLSARLLSTEVVLRPGLSGLPVLPEGATARQTPEGAAIELRQEEQLGPFLKVALDKGAQVVSVSPRRESLEDFFIRQAQARGSVGDDTASSGARSGS